MGRWFTLTKRPARRVGGSGLNFSPRGFRLTVVNGEGSGIYEAGAEVKIKAVYDYKDCPAEEIIAWSFMLPLLLPLLQLLKSLFTATSASADDTEEETEWEFVRWILYDGGDVENPRTADTTFTMPPNDATICAHFVSVSEPPTETLYHLRIIDGGVYGLTGSWVTQALLPHDALARIRANPAREGHYFNKWSRVEVEGEDENEGYFEHPDLPLLDSAHSALYSETGFRLGRSDATVKPLFIPDEIDDPLNTYYTGLFRVGAELRGVKHPAKTNYDYYPPFAHFNAESDVFPPGSFDKAPAPDVIAGWKWYYAGMATDNYWEIIKSYRGGLTINEGDLYSTGNLGHGEDMEPVSNNYDFKKISLSVKFKKFMEDLGSNHTVGAIDQDDTLWLCGLNAGLGYETINIHDVYDSGGMERGRTIHRWEFVLSKSSRNTFIPVLYDVDRAVTVNNCIYALLNNGTLMVMKEPNFVTSVYHANETQAEYSSPCPNDYSDAPGILGLDYKNCEINYRTYLRFTYDMGPTIESTNYSCTYGTTSFVPVMDNVVFFNVYANALIIKKRP